MKSGKIALFLVLMFAAGLALESCSSNKNNCGNKRQKKAQHARTKKMVGTGWVQ